MDPRGGKQEIASVQELIDTYVMDHDKVRVLEAGCGSLSRFNFGERAYVVGIDISQEQLDKNTTLHEKILGDIETHDFPNAEFDVIVCWYVFEHLPHPDRALMRFAAAVRNGGIVVLALPNLHSFKGLVTKYTPFWFHVWVRRHLLGRPLAGTLGHGPYPTFLPSTVAPERLMQRAHDLGLRTIHIGYFEDAKQVTIRKKFGLVGRRWRVAQWLIGKLSGGRLHAARTESVLVLSKSD